MEDSPLLIDFAAPTSLLREPHRTSALPVVGNGPPGTFVLFPNGLRVSVKGGAKLDHRGGGKLDH